MCAKVFLFNLIKFIFAFKNFILKVQKLFYQLMSVLFFFLYLEVKIPTIYIEFELYIYFLIYRYSLVLWLSFIRNIYFTHKRYSISYLKNLKRSISFIQFINDQKISFSRKLSSLSLI